MSCIHTQKKTRSISLILSKHISHYIRNIAVVKKCCFRFVFIWLGKWHSLWSSFQVMSHLCYKVASLVLPVKNIFMCWIVSFTHFICMHVNWIYWYETMPDIYIIYILWVILLKTGQNGDIQGKKSKCDYFFNVLIWNESLPSLVYINIRHKLTGWQELGYLCIMLPHKSLSGMLQKTPEMHE